MPREIFSVRRFCPAWLESVIRDEALSTVAAGCREAPGDIVAVYVFGSTARGTARPESDVDVGIVYRKPPEPTLLGQPSGARELTITSEHALAAAALPQFHRDPFDRVLVVLVTADEAIRQYGTVREK